MSSFRSDEKEYHAFPPLELTGPHTIYTPVHCPSRWHYAQYAEKTWKILKDAIHEINHRNASGLSFEELYRRVFLFNPSNLDGAGCPHRLNTKEMPSLIRGITFPRTIPAPLPRPFVPSSGHSSWKDVHYAEPICHLPHTSAHLAPFRPNITKNRLLTHPKPPLHTTTFFQLQIPPLHLPPHPSLRRTTFFNFFCHLQLLVCFFFLFAQKYFSHLRTPEKKKPHRPTG